MSQNLYRGRGRTIGETTTNTNRSSLPRENEFYDDEKAESDLQKAMRLSLEENYANTQPHESVTHCSNKDSFNISQSTINEIVHNPLKLRPILAKLPGVDQFDPTFDEFFSK